MARGKFRGIVTKAPMEKVLNSAMIDNDGRPGGADQEGVWIRCSQKGDVRAFNHLVLKWEQPIFNLCLRMMGNSDEASEVCQEVFLAAFRSIGKFRQDARFSTWLYRIAANRCLTRLKRRPDQAHYSLDVDSNRSMLEARLSQGQSQERLVMESERRERILVALDRLPAEQRAVVELKIYQDQKFEEIADALGAPLSTVKSRFYKSLEVLKRQLGHYCPSG